MVAKEPKAETPPPLELSIDDAKQLAESVRRIDKAMKDFIASGLSRKALVILLNDSTGVAKRDINSVLDGLESLGETYLDATKK